MKNKNVVIGYVQADDVERLMELEPHNGSDPDDYFQGRYGGFIWEKKFRKQRGFDGTEAVKVKITIEKI